MLISLKVNGPPVPPTSEEEEGAADGSKVPNFKAEDYLRCACCKVPFSAPESEVKEDEQVPKRGQVGVIESKKIKEFYSFNVVTGELLHVTGLQALLAIFELRLSKCSSALNLTEVNENLVFCVGCGALVSQLYKLNQELRGLAREGSVLTRLLEYEEALTDIREGETDFVNPTRGQQSQKKKRGGGEAELSGGISWTEDENNDGMDDRTQDDLDNNVDWNHDDDNQEDYGDDRHDDMDVGEDDRSFPDDEAGGSSSRDIKPRVRGVGLKITSVESTNMEEAHTARGRRTAKVNYRKVLEGDDDEDEEWTMESEGQGGRKSKTPAKRKASGPAPASKRGRASKSPRQTQAPSPRGGTRTPATVTSGYRSSPTKPQEAACQLCKKLFPASYLTEHMRMAHGAGSTDHKCLICDRGFDNSYKSIKHLLTHIPEKQYGCTRCNDTFRTPEDRNEHTNSHPDFDQPLQCPKCPNNFPSLLLLNKHEAQKHRQTKSFLCSICAKLLTGKDEWIHHILSHGPFQCHFTQCKEFLRPNEYKRHIKLIHGGLHRPKPIGAPAGPIAEVTLD